MKKQIGLLVLGFMLFLCFTGCVSLKSTNADGLTAYDKMLAPRRYGNEMNPGLPQKYKDDRVFAFGDDTYVIIRGTQDSTRYIYCCNFKALRFALNAEHFADSINEGRRNTALGIDFGKLNLDTVRDDLSEILITRGLSTLYNGHEGLVGGNVYSYVDTKGSRFDFKFCSKDSKVMRTHGDKPDWYNRVQLVTYSLELKYEGTRDIDPIEEILWEREQEGWLNAAHESIQRYHVAFEKDERYRLHALQVNRENYNVVMAMYGSKTDWGTLFSSALAASLEDFTRDMERIQQIQNSAYASSGTRMRTSSTYSGDGTSQNESQSKNNKNQAVIKSYSISYSKQIQADSDGESYVITAAKHMGIGELVRKINHDGYSDVAGTNKSIIMSDCSFSNINTSYSEDHGIGYWTISMTASWSGPVVPINTPRIDSGTVQSN